MIRHLPSTGKTYDLLVIGGGINGAGVARDAALRGLRVALVEQNDFASGASSKTSKLIHGGLRYLEHGDLRLVWEACRERRTLLQLAPHLVRPQAFAFPVYRDSHVSPLKLQVGMWLYDLMAMFRNIKRYSMLAKDTVARWGLATTNLLAVANYYDAVMDDARLVIETLLDARNAGADTFNYCPVDELLFDMHGAARGIRIHDALLKTHAELYATRICICTGAWSNTVLRMTPTPRSVVSPTRGTHIIVPRFTDRSFTLTMPEDGRILFVIPWFDVNLIGTTDVALEDAALEATASESEIVYLLRATEHFFPSAKLQRADVLSAFAGLRPLLASDSTPGARSREHSVLEIATGLLCVVGGKYTTYRAVAKEVVDRISRHLPQAGPCRTASTPIGGGKLPWSANDHWHLGPGFLSHLDSLAGSSELSREQTQRLFSVYGSRAQTLIDWIQETPDLAHQVSKHHPALKVEILLALRQEQACHLDDWFLRRSRMGYMKGQGRDSIEEIADLFASELGWPAKQREVEIRELQKCLDEVNAIPLPASNR